MNSTRRYLILFSLLLLPALASVQLEALSKDPFSKITVKSQRALLSKSKNDSSRFCLQYKTNVSVTLADSTTVSSDILDVFVNTKKDKEEGTSDVEKIVFKDRVKMNRENRHIKADMVEIFAQEKRCMLKGNVVVEQKNDGKKSVPVVTRCEQAQFFWGKDEVELVGSETKPVCTKIELGGRVRAKQEKKAT